MLQAIIFDLDGTLVTSELDFDAIRAEIGDVDGPVLEHLETAAPAARRRAVAVLERHEREAAERCALKDGARETLRALHDRALRLGLLTRNSQASVETVCARHRLEFEVVLAREDAPPKPAAEPVLLACRRLGVAPDRTLMVGDYRFDIEAGSAAGAWTALLCDHGRRWPDVTPDFEIQTLAELLNIVHDLQTRDTSQTRTEES